ncbi:superoxide dismutase family protein [Robertkochia aurantiaca]|uniref:superoxide dismutase family protein n=1 Tax=Robertkochia aurantiaca TaxID=2873700 RepID=UPI001CCE40AF|nr:superoxide dismutase family protein [Robertkochia sp. 3YJGBD-33]
MKRIIGITAIAAMLAMTSCKGKEEKKDELPAEDTMTTESAATEGKMGMEDTKKVTVEMMSKSGSDVKGNVVFTQENGEVNMTAVFDGLEPGEHAIHLHEEADCSADDATSTGGHWNPTYAQHGKWGDAEGYHKGDIGNFTADENGNGTITFETDEWCIGCGDTNKDILGKAVIVHQGTDDFTSQPSGAAGARVSCGGVIME